MPDELEGGLEENAGQKKPLLSRVMGVQNPIPTLSIILAQPSRLIPGTPIPELSARMVFTFS